MREAAEERSEPYVAYGERAPKAATKQIAAPTGLLLQSELLDNRGVPALVVRL